MKLRRILVLAGMCIGIMAMPVGAKTSQLDVKAGDICSYYTYKDTGSAYENYYYVTPTTYVGKYIMGNSISKNGKYSSGYTNEWFRYKNSRRNESLFFEIKR